MFYLSLEIMNTKRNKLPNAVSVLNIERERERERIRKKHHANWHTHTRCWNELREQTLVNLGKNKLPNAFSVLKRWGSLNFIISF